MRFAHSWLYVNTLRSSERTWPSHRGNATSLPCPGRRALGQAESSVGKGDGIFPKNPGKGRKVSEGRMQGAEGTSLLWPRGSRKLEEMSKGEKGGWQLLETPLRGGWAKLYRPVCKDTMNRREFVYKPS